jgi:predicted transcriptional regulator
MANLQKLAALLNTEFPEPKTSDKPIGHKRRSWIQNDYKGSIDTIDKLDLSTQSINTVHETGSSTRFIKPVHESGFNKGSINRVDKLGLKDLRSNPLKLIQFMYEISHLDKHRITPKITLTTIMQTLSLSRDSARTGLRFLLKNNLIERINNKVGKNGWSQYSIKNDLFIELEKAVEAGEIKLVRNTENEKGSISSSSSSINKTTTTELDEWENIDCKPLSEIGFRAEHLKQLTEKTTPEIVRESIEHFAWGLRNNGSAAKCASKLGAFISALKRGVPWTEPALLERDNIVIQAMIEAKEHKEKERKVAIEELFSEWDSSLSEEEKRKYESGILSHEAGRRAERKEYFIKKILSANKR